MKTFDKLYSELQNDDNSEMNDLLKRVKDESKKSNKLALIICLILDIFIVLGYLGSNVIEYMGGIFEIQMFFSVVVCDVFVFLIVKSVYNKSYREYSQKYKNVIINKLISNFYDNVEYFPTKSIPPNIYDEAEYKEYYNRYYSEDYLEGYIDNTYSIQMAEVFTEDSSGDDTSTKFIGLFAKIVMHKSIQGELRIMRDGSYALDNKLKMDSSEFEKCFDVKASDNIKGMQLLTADVMEELIEFGNNTRMRFDIVIRNNELYLRFHCGRIFEPRTIKNVLDKEEVQKYFYMLNFTYNLSKRLISFVKETEM